MLSSERSLTDDKMSDEEFRNHACILPVIFLKQMKKQAPLHASTIAHTQFILYMRHNFFSLSLQNFPFIHPHN